MDGSYADSYATFTHRVPSGSAREGRTRAVRTGGGCGRGAQRMLGADKVGVEGVPSGPAALVPARERMRRLRSGWAGLVRRVGRALVAAGSRRRYRRCSSLSTVSGAEPLSLPSSSTICARSRAFPTRCVSPTLGVRSPSAAGDRVNILDRSQATSEAPEKRPSSPRRMPLVDEWRARERAERLLGASSWRTG